MIDSATTADQFKIDIKRALKKVGIAAVVFVGRCGSGQRIAQGVDSPGGIPCGNDDFVLEALCDWREAKGCSA